MIGVHETLQPTGQAPFAKHDHAVPALAANGADDPFHGSTLPGRGRVKSRVSIDRLTRAIRGRFQWKYHDFHKSN
jgi:hypothetical protein